MDINPLVRDVSNAASARIEQHRHTLSLTIPENPVLVDGDTVRLEQVVANLLENAVKYTPAGGRIWLSLSEESGEAVLSVRDSGVGLAPDMLERIFELFTQVDSTLARSGGGLGLGLTVVRRLLELHEGRIEARSAGLGHGSEFIVRLPLLVPHNESLERPIDAQLPALPTARNRRVLVVDDNVDAGDSMAAIVSTWGHEVAIARDAEEALEMATKFRPDTALVDIGLPGMNGYDLARRWRQTSEGRALTLVAMTGYGRAEDRAEAREAGFDVHLVKPAELGELENLLAGNT